MWKVETETGEELHRHSYGRVRGRSTASQDKTVEPRDGDDDDRRQVRADDLQPYLSQVDQISEIGVLLVTSRLSEGRHPPEHQNREQRRGRTKMLDIAGWEVVKKKKKKSDLL